jgi:alpha-mannosidase
MTRRNRSGITGRISWLTPFAWNAGNVVLSSFKRAYDGGGYILRLFENEGRETGLALHVPGFSLAWLADLNESPGEPLVLVAGRLDLQVKPYKIFILLLR